MMIARKCGVLLFLAVLGLGSSTTTHAGIVHDAASDFSIASNPNGVWSYGWSSTLTGSMVLDTVASAGSQVDAWFGPIAGFFPVVEYNHSATAFNSGTVSIDAHQVVLHPGPGGEVAILRFTAPTAGAYSIGASFIGVDVVGTSTDTHVVVDGVSLYNGTVVGFGSGTGGSYSNSSILLNAGSTVELRVGFGTGGYVFDSTGVSLTVESLTAVPEPGTIGLAVAGALFGLVLQRNRRSV